MSRKKERNQHDDAENKFKMVPGPGAIVKKDGSWLEPQLHGGTLKRSGVDPKKGPPPSALRGRMRAFAADHMYEAVEILSPQEDPCTECGHPKEASASDRLKALDLLCRYGIGVKQEKFSPELIRALALSVQAEVHDDRILKQIEARWAVVLREHVTGESQ